jgi:hypothetical protein
LALSGREKLHYNCRKGGEEEVGWAGLDFVGMKNTNVHTLN